MEKKPSSFVEITVEFGKFLKHGFHNLWKNDSLTHVSKNSKMIRISFRPGTKITIMDTEIILENPDFIEVPEKYKKAA